VTAEINAKHPGSTLPNPHKGENVVLLTTGGFLVLTGLVALTIARLSFSPDIEHGSKVAASVVAAIVLLLAGGRLLAIAFKQLRFVFVMESLSPLADLLDKDEVGVTIEADQLRKRLRNNQPILHEPRGAIDGLLFKLIPAMSQTPPTLVRTALAQFFNGLVLAATLLTFAFALFGSTALSRSWIGFLYFLFSAILLIRPLLRSAQSAAPLNEKRMIALMVAAAIVPPILSLLLSVPAPGSTFIAFGAQAALIMIAGLAGSILFVVALKALTQPPPITDIANAQHAINIHTTPNQIFNELEREIMSHWVNRMPNRRYLEIKPDTRFDKGSFTGELIEETMPQPQNAASMSLSEALGSPVYRGVAWLDLYGAMSAIIGGLLLIVGLATNVIGANFLVSGFALLAVGLFCLFGANSLWRRFEFTSRIYWIEAMGDYQRSRADFGAQLHGEVRTSRETTFVEAMTLRVWCANIISISYQLKQARYLVHISGDQTEASRLLDHLVAQVVPLGGTAARAIEQVTALKLAREQRQIHQQLSAAETSDSPTSDNPASVISQPPPSCPLCGHAATPAAKFCGECGTQIAISQ
jgi:hypothetical protein